MRLWRVGVVALCALASWSPLAAQTQVRREGGEQRSTRSPAKQAKACEQYRQALAHLAGGQLATAQGCLEKATVLLPDWSEPRNMLAFVHCQRGNVKAARAHWEEVLRYEPQNLFARSSLVELDRPAGQKAVTTELWKPSDQFQRPTQDQRLTEYEEILVRRINEERATRDLPALIVDAKLTQQARDHSEEMRELGYFDHISPTAGRKTVLDRYLLHHDKPPPLLAENVSRRWGQVSSISARNVDNSHQGLMQSSGHRRNILHPRVTHVGVGIAVNSHGDYWITEVFAQLPQ